MHFNIYVDDQTGKQLNKLAKQYGRNRNALIREALEEWISHQTKPEWPKEVLEFKGVKNFPPFEKHRDKLKNPKEDPFA